MPGANCSIFGCNTSRRHKDISIFRLPSAKNELSKKWRAELINIVTRDRETDENMKRQIENNFLHICQRHFKDDDLYHCENFVFYILYSYSKQPINFVGTSNSHQTL